MQVQLHIYTDNISSTVTIPDVMAIRPCKGVLTIKMNKPIHDIIDDITLSLLKSCKREHLRIVNDDVIVTSTHSLVVLSL